MSLERYAVNKNHSIFSSARNQMRFWNVLNLEYELAHSCPECQGILLKEIFAFRSSCEI